MAIDKCSHGKTVFESCDQCEIAWLRERIKTYEAKLVSRRADLTRLVEKMEQNPEKT